MAQLWLHDTDIALRQGAEATKAIALIEALLRVLSTGKAGNFARVLKAHCVTEQIIQRQFGIPDGKAIRYRRVRRCEHFTEVTAKLLHEY
ncbi:MAG TPA: hypothetical protein VNN62_13605 [Methylomirabilota bacterium]|jgi:hypothetical protein|nr:hypothetical protein [Methylomirabilota bacterium]